MQVLDIGCGAAYLNKDTFGVGAGHSMHSIKGELEVGLVQQRLEAIKVKDGTQQLQVVLHWIYHLHRPSAAAWLLTRAGMHCKSSQHPGPTADADCLPERTKDKIAQSS